VQQSNADILFELANGGGGAPLLYAQAIRRAGKAPHLGNPDEDEDWLKVMHLTRPDWIGLEEQSVPYSVVCHRLAKQ
jgi:hypothetical protein